MSETGGTEEITDYSKMKVNDLKKLLKNRGLSLTGNKQELIERLQSNEAASEDLLDGSEVGDELVGDVADEDLEQLDETALLNADENVDEKPEAPEPTSDVVKTDVKEEPASSTPSKSVTVPKVAVPKDTATKPAEDKTTKESDSSQVEVPNTTQEKRKISLKGEVTSGNEADKKKLRAERFGAAGEEPKKDTLAKRAERFSINSTTTSTNTSTPDKDKVPQSEILKKRAERFGILSPAEQKKQMLEKLQARKARFNSSGLASTDTETTTATATIAAVPVLPNGVKPTTLSIEERKKLRAQRFNMNTK